MCFEILKSQALPFEPALHLSKALGIIGSDKQIVKPFTLAAALFDIFRQHTENRKDENSKSQNIEDIISYSITHKRAYTVEKKI